MKNLIASILICCVSLFSYAQNTSTLQLKIWDTTPFYIVLDQVEYPQPSNEIVIQQIIAGRHSLQVMRLNNGLNRAPEKVYDGFIEVQPNVDIFAKITAFNMINISTAVKSNYVISVHQYISGNQNTVVVQEIREPAVPQAMKPEDFTVLKTTLTNASFENSKLSVAKQAINSNNFSSYQIYEMMLLFDFESSRLEIAKAAYLKTIDKQNYFMVQQALDFSSSKTNLTEYIESLP